MTPEERATKVACEAAGTPWAVGNAVYKEALVQIREAYEDAARIAEQFNAELYRDPGDGSWRPGQPAISDGKRIAAAIRALAKDEGK